MTFDYTRSRATAERLIAKFGAAATLTRKTVTGEGYDPSISTTDHAVTAVAVAYEVGEIDGVRVLASDRKVLVSTKGLEVEPQPGDVLTISGAAHAVVSVKPLAPGGVVVMWEAQARK